MPSPLAQRNLPDRSRPRARKCSADIPPIQGNRAQPLAAALQKAGFQNGTRAAIIMTNQSKWLISAYAIFFCGGVLVPLDYKLTPAEQLKLLAHSEAEFLVTEYHLVARNDAGEELCRSAHARGSGNRGPGGRRSERSAALGRISRSRTILCSFRARGKMRLASCIPRAPGGARRAACLRTRIIWSSVSRSLLFILFGPASAI